VKAGQLSMVARLFNVSYRQVLPWFEIVRILAATVAAGAAVYVFLVQHFYPGLTLIIGFPVFVSVYLASAYRLGLITNEDLQKIWSSLRTRLVNSNRLREV
jgi:hypothetical protein